MLTAELVDEEQLRRDFLSKAAQAELVNDDTYEMRRL